MANHSTTGRELTMATTANEVDAHVGQRMRKRRESLGMSQGQLGRHLGLTFSQVQKYEKGANRIGAGRLYLLASLLSVPVHYFFEGGPGQSCRDRTARPDRRPGDPRRRLPFDRRPGDPAVGAGAGLLACPGGEAGGPGAARSAPAEGYAGSRAVAGRQSPSQLESAGCGRSARASRKRSPSLPCGRRRSAADRPCAGCTPR